MLYANACRDASLLGQRSSEWPGLSLSLLPSGETFEKISWLDYPKIKKTKTY